MTTALGTESTSHGMVRLSMTTMLYEVRPDAMTGAYCEQEGSITIWTFDLTCTTNDTLAERLPAADEI